LETEKDWILISADFKDSSPFQIWGHVEGYVEDEGLVGWAVNLSDTTPLDVELLLDDAAIGRTSCTYLREDVAAAAGKKIEQRTGFRFPPSSFSHWRKYSDLIENSRIKIKLANKPLLLPGPELSLADVLKSSSTSEAAISSDTYSLLDELRNSAHELLSNPFRPHDEKNQGYVEAVSIDEEGFIWLVGWIRDGGVFDFPCVVVDKKKIPAGLTISTYEREDLPKYAVGFIGVLTANWLPNLYSEIFIYFGPEGEYHLRSVSPLKLLQHREMLSRFESLRPFSKAHRYTPLSTLMYSERSWTLSTETETEVKVAVDRALMLPGFGIFVEGWILTPLREVRSLKIRCGQVVLNVKEGNLIFKPRPDLLAVYPGEFVAVEKAGFIGVFEGHVSPSDVKSLLLKIIFVEGNSINVEISTNVIRRIGHSAQLDSLLALFPSLESAEFFSRMSSAYRGLVYSGTKQLERASVKRAKSACIFVVPKERHDIHLLFDEIKYYSAKNLPPECGLVFVASVNQRHGEMSGLLASLEKVVPNPCSLFFVQNSELAIYSLPEITLLTQTSNFCYMGSNIFLSKSGWAHLTEAMNFSGLVFLEICLPSQPEFSAKTSSLAFSWSANELRRWLLEEPFLISGEFLAHNFPNTESVMVTNAAYTIHPTSRSMLFNRIDQLNYFRRDN
jgi:hypothetical protein